MNEFKAIEKTFYIAHNNSNIVHYGALEIGQNVTTGQPILETYQSQVSWENRLLELGITQTEIDNYNTEN